jgi:hypothetical protein
MAFRVNYNQQRNDRDRAKQAKKDAKLREQEAELMRRRNGTPSGSADDAAPSEGAADGAEPAKEGEANGTP